MRVKATTFVTFVVALVCCIAFTAPARAQEECVCDTKCYYSPAPAPSLLLTEDPPGGGGGGGLEMCGVNLAPGCQSTSCYMANGQCHEQQCIETSGAVDAQEIATVSLCLGVNRETEGGVFRLTLE